MWYGGFDWAVCDLDSKPVFDPELNIGSCSGKKPVSRVWNGWDFPRALPCPFVSRGRAFYSARSSVSGTVSASLWVQGLLMAWPKSFLTSGLDENCEGKPSILFIWSDSDSELSQMDFISKQACPIFSSSLTNIREDLRCSGHGEYEEEGVVLLLKKMCNQKS